jgi:hypothetical protein
MLTAGMPVSGDGTLRRFSASRKSQRECRWAATQAEARWRFANRWIGTAFVGVGEIQPVLPRSAEADSLPAAGVAIHWIAAVENLITVRLQYGVGEAGVNAWYVAIGQSF